MTNWKRGEHNQVLIKCKKCRKWLLSTKYKGAIRDLIPSATCMQCVEKNSIHRNIPKRAEEPIQPPAPRIGKAPGGSKAGTPIRNYLAESELVKDAIVDNRLAKRGMTRKEAENLAESMGLPARAGHLAWQRLRKSQTWRQRLDQPRRIMGKTLSPMAYELYQEWRQLLGRHPKEGKNARIPAIMLWQPLVSQNLLAGMGTEMKPVPLTRFRHIWLNWAASGYDKELEPIYANGRWLTKFEHKWYGNIDRNNLTVHSARKIAREHFRPYYAKKRLAQVDTKLKTWYDIHMRVFLKTGWVWV